MKNIRIVVDNISAVAELTDSKTSEALWNALPVENTVNTWGDEIYFEVPVATGLDETAREVVEKGDLGYWPTGKAFCIFFGPTPVSQGDEIRPASAVNIIGKVVDDTKVFKSVQQGANIRLEKVEIKA